MKCLGCGPHIPPQQAATVVLPQPAPQQQPQDAVHWEGWGTSLAWFAHAAGSNDTLREQLCSLLFSRDPSQGLGMNIVRYNIGGACQDHASEYRTGAAVPCFRQPDGTYDWEADKSQVAMLLEAARLGADTFEAFVNSPPYFFTVSGTSRGHERPLANNLAKQHVADFATFCADVLCHFASVHGIKMQSLSPFNEPNSPAWCLKLGSKQEGCYFSKSQAHTVLRALVQQPALQDTQLVGFEEFCVRDSLSRLNCLPKDLWPALHRINTHTYSSKHFFVKPLKLLLLWQDNKLWRKRLQRLLQRHNKPLWVSEFGTGRGPLALAQQVLQDLSTLRPNAWVYWQAAEGVGSGGWGLMEVPLEAAAAAGVAAAGQTAAAGTAAAAEATAVTDGVVDAAAASSSAVGSTQQTVTLHPGFFVMQFLMQCLPPGCLLHTVKGLGQHGVAARHSQQHWVVVVLNPSSAGSKALSLDASALVRQAAPALLVVPVGAAAASGDGAAAGPAAAAAAVEGAAAVEARQGPATIKVCLLNIPSLQPVVVPQGGIGINSSAGAAGVSAGVALEFWERPVEQWPVTVEVPPQHLCRIDVVVPH